MAAAYNPCPKGRRFVSLADIDSVIGDPTCEPAFSPAQDLIGLCCQAAPSPPISPPAGPAAAAAAVGGGMPCAAAGPAPWMHADAGVALIACEGRADKFQSVDYLPGYRCGPSQHGGFCCGLCGPDRNYSASNGPGCAPVGNGFDGYCCPRPFKAE